MGSSQIGIFYEEHSQCSASPALSGSPDPRLQSAEDDTERRNKTTGVVTNHVPTLHYVSYFQVPYICALYPKYFPSLHTDLINVCSQYPYEECVTAAVETKKLGHQVATRLTWGDTERLGKNWEQNADPKAPRPPPSYRESTSGERQFYKLAAYNTFLKHTWLNVLKIANVDKPVLFPNKWRRV